MRSIIAVITVVGAVATIALAQTRLGLLRVLPDASAVQIMQIHAEAQTILLEGILGTLVVIACALLVAPRLLPYSVPPSADGSAVTPTSAKP